MLDDFGTHEVDLTSYKGGRNGTPSRVYSEDFDTAP